MSARTLGSLPERAISEEDVLQGRVADAQVRAADADGAVVNGVVPGTHHGGPCAFLTGLPALEFAYGEGRHALSSAQGWQSIIGRRFGRAVLNSDEPEHAAERRMWSPAFATTALGHALPVMRATLHDASARWHAAGEIDAYGQAREASFVVMARALAGLDDEASARLFGAFAAVLDGARPGEGAEAAHARLVPVRDALEEELRSALADARRRGGDGPGLVPVLLRAEPRVSDARLLTHLNVLMLAGHETTASLLGSLLLALCDAPAWQEDLAGEIARLPESAALTVAALEALPLATAFVAEVARLHCPLLNAPRVASVAFEHGGVRVPAGHHVALAIGASHRMAPFERPELFDPTRFAATIAAGRSPAILAFATGARHCLGARFARLEAKMLLATLLRAYRVERATPGTTRDTGFWNIRPKGALAIRLVERGRTARAA
jgi:cytochrome P450